jgi:hypothetical protein
METKVAYTQVAKIAMSDRAPMPELANSSTFLPKAVLHRP